MQTTVSPLASDAVVPADVRTNDLGFGSVVGRQSGQRLLNRDGSFNVVRSGLGLVESVAPYHHLLTISWPRFLWLVTLAYLALNVVFALGFVACGPDALLGPGADMLGGRFSRAFYFSVQTFATIGYGQIGPNGFLPNLLVTVEALVGLMYQALATGLLFARFARPTASILFSRRAVIAPYNNGSALMFRVANRRRNEIIRLEAQVLFSSMESDAGGAHPIDEASPLFRKTAAELEQRQAEILVLLSGTDETFAQTVHARSSYRTDEIAWNSRFRSVFLQDARHQRVTVDVSRLHEIEPLDA